MWSIVCLQESCSSQSEDNWQFLVRKVRYISQMLRTAEHRTFIDTEQQKALSVSICNCERGLRFADAIIVTRFQKRRYFTRNNLRTARKIESVAPSQRAYKTDRDCPICRRLSISL